MKLYIAIDDELDQISVIGEELKFVIAHLYAKSWDICHYSIYYIDINRPIDVDVVSIIRNIGKLVEKVTT